jgi:hypothetical protein
MTKYVLVIIDSGGIQDYVFGSNKLQLNVAASYLVALATRDWVIETLSDDGLGLTHNVLNINDEGMPFDLSKKIEEGEIDVEVILAGGGNTRLIFREGTDAQEFIRRLSYRILEEAPGLRITFQSKTFDWDKDALGGKDGIIAKAIRELARRKAQLSQHPPVLGMGVTVQDIYTGLPAVGINKDGNAVSAEIAAKFKKLDEANQRLHDLFKSEMEGYKFAWRFEDIKSPVDSTRDDDTARYIAVVHADGNSMGKRIRALSDTFDQAGDGNRKYINATRTFSESIRKRALKTVRQLIQKTIAVLGAPTRDTYLPFRPIVFGGDDITFVTEGHWGLTLAAYYIQQFSSGYYTDGEKNYRAYARAGVAVVKAHYPFARAYELAESLAQSAKEQIPDGGQGSAIDWHFAPLGPIFDLKEIRKREYTGDNGGNLLMRPVHFATESNDWRSWNNLKKIVREFNEKDKWTEKHNKVMRLRSALRQGPNAVKNFIKTYKVDLLPEVEGLTKDVRKTGWTENRCVYFDAIETKDFFIPLEAQPSEKDEEAHHA